MRYPVRVFIPVFLILVSLGLPFLGVRFSAPDASILPPSVPSRAAFDLLAKRFNDRETTPILMAVQTKGNVMTILVNELCKSPRSSGSFLSIA